MRPCFMFPQSFNQAIPYVTFRSSRRGFSSHRLSIALHTHYCLMSNARIASELPAPCSLIQTCMAHENVRCLWLKVNGRGQEPKPSFHGKCWHISVDQWMSTHTNIGRALASFYIPISSLLFSSFRMLQFKFMFKRMNLDEWFNVWHNYYVF